MRWASGSRAGRTPAVPVIAGGAPARPVLGLARYVFAATLVRSADGGAVVAIVLLAQASGMSGWESGLLAASITAPHLLGPFVARYLDTARDGRKLIAVSAALHGVLLGAAAVLMTTAGALWPALLLLVSGAFGPMLTGGISSRLPAIAGASQHSQRRAQGWDVASYGLGGTLGPAAVAWIAAASDALTATLALSGAAVLGATAVLVLPRQAPPTNVHEVSTPGQVLKLMWTHGPLRRTLGLTIVVAFAVAALPIYAVVAAPSLGGATVAGTLVAGYGVGTLLGSAALMVRPLRRDADALLGTLAALVGAALVLVIFVPTFAGSLVAFGLAGLANAMFFGATLAARSEYAPVQSRGQVFVWVGALKIAAGSAGTAVAGTAAAADAAAPLILAVALIAVSTAVSLLDRARRRPV